MSKPNEPMRSVTRALCIIYPKHVARERAAQVVQHMRLSLIDANEWPILWDGCLELVSYHRRKMVKGTKATEVEIATVAAMKHFIRLDRQSELMTFAALVAIGVPEHLLRRAA